MIKLDTIPQSSTGDVLMREDPRNPESSPRDLRSLLMQAVSDAPIAGWMQIAQGIQRPMPDEPASIIARVRLLDRLEQSNGAIDLSGDERTLLEKCVSAEFVVGAVSIMRAVSNGSAGE